MKADRKPLPVGKMRPILPADRAVAVPASGGRVMWRYLLAFILQTSMAEAELLHASVPVTLLAMGGHCETDPTEIIPAPNASGGYFERDTGGYDYIELGDRIAARLGMGLALRVRFPTLRPWSTVTVRIEPPPGGVTGSFDLTLGQDGMVEFGRLPADGATLAQGLYRLSVLDRGKLLWPMRSPWRGWPMTGFATASPPDRQRGALSKVPFLF